MQKSQIFQKPESQNQKVTDEEIRYAEAILFPERTGEIFDAERKIFIKNLETIDLQAVPGSGKTTALLAKLIILERKLPFKDGSGILVLSHSNAAIDEIKDRLQHVCPKLFQYPNFIGTVQSFVDRFLAIPYFFHCRKKGRIRIDNEAAEKQFNYNFPHNLLASLDKKHGDKKLLKQAVVLERKLVHFHTGDILKMSFGEGTTTYNKIIEVKEKVLKEGYLRYNDTYFLAQRFLQKFTQIKGLLQKRFNHVFVDEMQDMEKHQYDLLEQIFFDDGKSSSIYQRIGDKNQAIYGSASRVGESEIWVERVVAGKDANEVNLRLKNSHRLSGSIAKVVSNFGLGPQKEEIVGQNECAILPHILIYNDDTVEDVIGYYARLVKKFKDAGELKNFNKYPIKAVAWSAEWKNDTDRNDKTKIRLWDYWKSYEKNREKIKQDYDYLLDYLLYVGRKKGDAKAISIKPISDNIINALLKVLRLEGVKEEGNKHFSKTSLLKRLKEPDGSGDGYAELRSKIYGWAKDLLLENKNLKEVRNDVAKYVESDFLKTFQTRKIQDNTRKFLHESSTKEPNVEVVKKEIGALNIFHGDGVDIELASVHAVKGQTHCATLYLDTYYKKSYESEKLKHRFLDEEKEKESKQAVKMVYVGFSRPTDFLCVAIHQDRFDQKFHDGIEAKGWKIKTVPKSSQPETSAPPPFFS